MSNNFTALNLEDMATISSGTFTSNKFSEWCDQGADSTTIFHLFANDDSILNGITHHENTVSAIMDQKGWQTARDSLKKRKRRPGKQLKIQS